MKEEEYMLRNILATMGAVATVVGPVIAICLLV